MSSFPADLSSVPLFVDRRHWALHVPQASCGPSIGLNGRNLTIVLLSCNRIILSQRLLRSIVSCIPDFSGEIIIADNGSDADELAELRVFLDSYPLRWRLLEFGVNHGVAGGRNRAFAVAATDWIMSLDNDIYFVENPLPAIQEHLAVLGCHFMDLILLNPDLETIYAAGGHLHLIMASDRPQLTIASLLPPGTPVRELSRLAEGSAAFLCSFIYGGASVLNRHTFDSLGGFDDAMLIGFEDIDFSLRVFRAGLKVATSKVVALVHDHPKADSAPGESYERNRYSRSILKASADYLERKHGYVIWGEDVDHWLQEQEKIQEFMVAGGSRDGAAALQRCDTTPRKPRIALVVDTDNWAFANIATQLTRHLNHRYDLHVIALDQLSDIEESRCLNQSAQRSSYGLIGAMRQIVLLAREYDLIHCFDREWLVGMEGGFMQSYARELGIDFDHFRTRFLHASPISAAVYDHLSLDPANIERLRSVFCNIVAGYCVASERLADIYRQIPGYPPPAAVLPDGVDLDSFKPCNLERLRPPLRRDLVIGWAGNSRWAPGLGEDFKGVHTILIPAIRALQDAGAAVRLALADRQQAHIPHDQMPQYYAGIDVYVCTSQMEGTPNPVLEAMACGVPVITTDVGVVSQAFGPLQQQMILPERRVACLQSAIRQLLVNPALLPQLSNENLASIRAWDWRSRARQFAPYFDRLLARPSRRPLPKAP